MANSSRKRGAPLEPNSVISIRVPMDIRPEILVKLNELKQEGNLNKFIGRVLFTQMAYALGLDSYHTEETMDDFLYRALTPQSIRSLCVGGRLEQAATTNQPEQVIRPKPQLEIQSEVQPVKVERQAPVVSEKTQWYDSPEPAQVAAISVQPSRADEDAPIQLETKTPPVISDEARRRRELLKQGARSFRQNLREIAGSDDDE